MAEHYAAGFRSYIHSGQQIEVEAGRTYRSMDFVQGIIKQNGNNMMGRPPISNFEQNADIVHVKLMRNNTFITVMDSKGNKKLGTSAGKLATTIHESLSILC
ncbi:putative ribosomal protein S11 [Forsythia ovata]|uniref:Ribosomal protein S11 n=1 Tax=Forsythia ovata TaxID=205694 RepID=A0ABD1TBF2_9LAMI